MSSFESRQRRSKAADHADLMQDLVMLQPTDTFDSEENYHTATKQKAQICSDKQLRAACSQPEFNFHIFLTQYPASTALKKKETMWSNSDAKTQFCALFTVNKRLLKQKDNIWLRLLSLWNIPSLQ